MQYAGCKLVAQFHDLKRLAIAKVEHDMHIAPLLYEECEVLVPSLQGEALESQ